MVSAVVVADFTVNGVTYRKGQQISISKDQYDEWRSKGWVGQIDGSADPDWCPPTSDDT